MHLPSPLQEVKFVFGCTCFVKRDDLIHPEVSGNKYRKLKYIFEHLTLRGIPGIITLGGAFSNHIYAAATYARLKGLKSIGLIRGEQDVLNPTLQYVQAQGMQLYFISRQEYRNKSESEIIQNIQNQHPEFMFIPEGGDLPLAYIGVMEVIDEIKEQGVKPDYLAVSAGTGNTASGLLRGIKKLGWNTKLIVMPAIQSTHLKKKILADSEGEQNDLFYFEQFSHGGYAKTNKELIDFMHQYYEQTNIPTDPVYTGKLVYGLNQLSKNNFFKPADVLVWLHTGGLQGVKGYNYMQAKKPSGGLLIQY